MAKNAVQEERMKRYFIEATKEILKGEGLRAVNVRSIAQKAGYSFATIYNYFKDAKDLVFECVKDILQECEEFIESETKNAERGNEKLKAISKAYIKYFVQYPGTFELFFIEKPNNLAGKQSTIKMIDEFYEKICRDEWEYVIGTNNITETEKKVMHSRLNYTILGLLLLYIQRGQPATYSEFLTDVDLQLNSILD